MGFFLLFFSLVSFLGTPLSRHGAHCAAGPRVGALERRLAEAGRGGHRPVPVVAVTLQPRNLRGGLRTFWRITRCATARSAPSTDSMPRFLFDHSSLSRSFVFFSIRTLIRTAEEKPLIESRCYSSFVLHFFFTGL